MHPDTPTQAATRRRFCLLGLAWGLTACSGTGPAADAVSLDTARTEFEAGRAVLIGNTQNRSRATLKALREQDGYGHVRYVEGGMSEWAHRGWPMVAPAR